MSSDLFVVPPPQGGVRGSHFTDCIVSGAANPMGVAAQMLRDGRRGYPPERVATVIWKALEARRPRTRYAVVPNRFINWTLPGIMPPRLLDQIMAGLFGLRASNRPM